MNLDNLTPPPWQLHAMPNVVDKTGNVIPTITLDRDDAEFAALARAAFDVMMRLAWWPVPCSGGILWKVETVSDLDDSILQGKFWRDPFTALVEADRLCKEDAE